MLRDLSATLPSGTECYLCTAVRNALAHYRKGHEPGQLADKDQAVSVLRQSLGRGLNRFLQPEIRQSLALKTRFESMA
ncbi:MAG: hypothetical protein CTY22_11515 [Methylomonas sp.]|nr:MAG: hypothetical protein CTY22_11515 [Methylomonas sp.]PPD32596.1 MAG: hypothetical protein CTY21_11440 [Methylomonas sp.]